MAPAVYNNTCDPFTPESEQCTLGNLVSYAVNASQPSDFSATIAFTKAKNIRLAVRNTGHDYLGKSTGAGSLAIWTHHMKDIQFLNYDGPHYKGGAVKLGAGVQVWDAYKAASKEGLTVVGGDCATVGVVGGYTQAGGHGALNSKFGLSADNALEWEVVDGRGHFLTASRTENSDLYWALSGGGGGSYGVVYSLTIKTHPDGPVTAVDLDFSNDGTNPDRFFDAIGYFHTQVPGYTAAGGYSFAEITNTSFVLTPLTLPDMHANQATELVQPFLDYLGKVGINYTKTITEFPGFLQYYNTLIEPNPGQAVENGQYGGRFIPRSVIDNHNDDLTAALRSITEDGVFAVSIGINVSSSVVGNDVYNSVHPSWREAAVTMVLESYWPEGANLTEMSVNARQMTEKWVPALAAVAPDSGCYLSEADNREVDWKQSFYGSNYQRLYSIKAKYDPDHVFYANTSVGSDDWSNTV
ncbi:MAG: hypothetical protein ASARMPRED_005337 [Alectoria sarmentosa]|nr:MAG: hypothetical protein ASARMPRED_005337 [Alectoria sarmentosa]